MRRRTLALVLAVLPSLLLAAGAHAGTISRPATDTIMFTGDARADDVTVTFDPTGSQVAFSDPAITIGISSTVATSLDCDPTDKTRRTIICKSLGANRKLQVALGAGDDRVQVRGEERDTAPIPEQLDGGDGNDSLNGGRGITVFHVEPGADRMFGGAGRDGVSYAGSPAGVTVSEDGLPNDGGQNDNVGSDIEQIVGTDFGDHLFAGAGGTELTGLGGDDVLTGGAGPDVLSPGPGRDIAVGGDGEDRVHYCCGPFTVSLDGLANDGQAGLGEGDNIGADVEDIEAEGPGLSALQGSPAANRFTIDGGNRAIANGLGGDDTFTAETGADSFSGGGGFDTVSYADRSLQFHSAPVTVTLDDVANDGRTSPLAENDNVQSDVEHVLGTEGGDRLTGSAGDETLDGGAGDDVIDGLAGADHLNGGDGDDVIRARDPLPTAFPDVVTCGAGADIITVDLQDQFSADCEDVAQAAIDQGPGLQIARRALRQDRRGRLSLRLACPRAEPTGCTGRLTIALRGRALVRGRYRVDPGARTTVRVRVRRHLKRGTTLRITARETDREGRPKLAIATRRVG